MTSKEMVGPDLAKCVDPENLTPGDRVRWWPTPKIGTVERVTTAADSGAPSNFLLRGQDGPTTWIGVEGHFEMLGPEFPTTLRSEILASRQGAPTSWTPMRMMLVTALEDEPNLWVEIGTGEVIGEDDLILREVLVDFADEVTCHGTELYWCPAGPSIECAKHAGHDVCCSAPNRHIPIMDLEKRLADLVHRMA